ncbi:MAG: c-type cytochrome [Erythrobacter sp.]|nr:MAG: c-type cytochrome [Erythrobacter sp.]
MTVGTVIAICAGLNACKPPPESRYIPDPANAERGRLAIERVGCAACHEIPGIDWPQGSTGPSLQGFDDYGPIAGQLPNTPANLAAFVRNAPLAKPGSSMPAMPLTEAEARDVAAYLHGLDDD